MYRLKPWSSMLRVKFVGAWESQLDFYVYSSRHFLSLHRKQCSKRHLSAQLSLNTPSRISPIIHVCRVTVNLLSCRISIEHKISKPKGASSQKKFLWDLPSVCQKVLSSCGFEMSRHVRRLLSGVFFSFFLFSSRQVWLATYCRIESQAEARRDVAFADF